MTDQTPAEPRRITQRQNAVLRRVERAFEAAEKAGLAFCGMDSDLLAYRADDLDRLAEESSLYDAQRALNEFETGTASQGAGDD